MWLERKHFPAIDLGPDDGLLQITTGVKILDVDHETKLAELHRRVFDESTLRICMEAVGFINIGPVDNHEAMVAPSSALGWQLALEGYKPKCKLRAEGRAQRQRSQDIG